MERLQRRSLLDTAPNPDGSVDYVSGIEGSFRFCGDGEEISVVMRYVPDRLILKAASFNRYLDALEDGGWQTVEEVAVTLLADLKNELVARWLQVTVRMEVSGLARIGTQGITMEDRQRTWSNDDLLDRLPPPR